MKFFIDTASIKEIREAAALGILDGGDHQSFVDGEREQAEQ